MFSEKRFIPFLTQIKAKMNAFLSKGLYLIKETYIEHVMLDLPSTCTSEILITPINFKAKHLRFPCYEHLSGALVKKN